MTLPGRLLDARRRLLLLTSDGAERLELMDFGVDERKVQTLYPDSFDSLAPVLAQILAKRSYSDLMQLAGEAHAASRVLYEKELRVEEAFGLPLMLMAFSAMSDEWMHASALSHWVKGLRIHLASRFAAENELEACDELADQVVMTLWCAHYFLANWDTLNSGQQDVAQDLAPRVVAQLGLQQSMS